MQHLVDDDQYQYLEAVDDVVASEEVVDDNSCCNRGRVVVVELPTETMQFIDVTSLSSLFKSLNIEIYLTLHIPI